jgi:uncharacterized protein YndB with AHSA1/START domain
MAEPGITIRRVFDAPREHVWRELTQPESFADWYAGPFEVPVDSVSMDLRPGGAWRATMLRADGGEVQWRGQYQEVDEPERLVFSITDQPGDGPLDIAVFVLTDLGDGRTEMLFEQRGGGLTPEGYERAGRGWNTFFDRIAERLAA